MAAMGIWTHLVRRASGYTAGYFHEYPPQSFVDECNTNVPDDPAHVEAIPEWPDEFYCVFVCAECGAEDHDTRWETELSNPLPCGDCGADMHLWSVQP